MEFLGTVMKPEGKPANGNNDNDEPSTEDAQKKVHVDEIEGTLNIEPGQQLTEDQVELNR